jgi:enoyl reductase
MGVRMQFAAFGGPEMVTAAEEELPPPADADVQVAVRAIGVNPMDWKVVAGYWRGSSRCSCPRSPAVKQRGR